MLFEVELMLRCITGLLNVQENEENNVVMASKQQQHQLQQKRRAVCGDLTNVSPIIFLILLKSSHNCELSFDICF